MIEIKNVSKSFGKVQALDDVSFEVEKGDVFGLIGQNGAGKSTLFRSMMNFFDDYSGEILYDGKPMAKVPLEKNRIFARRKVSFTKKDHRRGNPLLCKTKSNGQYSQGNHTKVV